jgi:energy-coupling factor transporter ATP-binding protein EcfA2
MLEARDLGFQYADHQALRGLNFKLEKNEKIALLGPNGAGKSTLLLQLAGATFGTGRLSLEGREVTPKDLHRLRQAVGLVFQNPDDQLFCPTVEEDVAYGPRCRGFRKETVAQKVQQALQAVSMQQAARRFPQTLSGGEKKRVALATVLVTEPQLLILDEPTSGLDARARRAVVDILRNLDTAILLATHDLDLAKQIATRALILDEGQLVYDGSLDDILAKRDFLQTHGLIA